ncbi:MAG: sugar ABC transporter substrate-binding protein [Christensenellaceae bacterium]
MKKIICIALCVVMILGVVAVGTSCAPAAPAAPAATDAPAATEAPAADASTAAPAADAPKEIPEGLVIGKIPITLANGYHQADVDWFTQLAKEQYGAEVKVLDGKFEQPTIVSNLDQLIAEGVDMIVLHSYEAESVVPGIDAARAAGIPIITFYLETPNNVPFVAINEAESAFQMGKVSAEKWIEFHPDKPIVYSVVDYIDNPTVQEMRTGPFIEGIKSVAPDAKEGMIVDGGGTRDTGYKVAQDIIQACPETNIFYGAASDYSLAIWPALQEAGRGKAVDGVPETEILVGTDATEAELMLIYDPSSSFKVTMGLTPMENAQTKLDTIMKAYTGEINPDEKLTVECTDKEIDYWTMPVDEAQKWLTDEYKSTADLTKAGK